MSFSSLKTNHPEHWKDAAALRILSAEAVHKAASGHQGLPIGMADVATVLFQNHLCFDANNPDWADRDRFVLSAGHGSMLLYAALHLSGYQDMTIEQIKNFRQWGAKTAGHPEYGHADGIETTTGPLGQGLANAVGMAIAEQSLGARFGKEIFDHHTYVIVGDGCLMEGISHEAIALAGRQKLNKLIVLWDDNNISIDGPVDITDTTDQIERFKAAGWATIRIDGHDPEAIDSALGAAKASDRPVFMACKTTIGIGVEGVENTSAAHGYAIKNAEISQMKKFYEWPYHPFEVPGHIRQSWLTKTARGAKMRVAWTKRFDILSPSRQAEFQRIFALELPERLGVAMMKLKKTVTKDCPQIATRKSSQTVLNVINPIMKEMIGGSADLTGSNNTMTKDLGVFDIDTRGGRHIYYGVREHAMAAIMNGMALHGGVRPYGGTFMCFTDYARPAMRLAALMGLPVVYVMTHDSIGLGEDGPTHQPIEHLAMCRATPNMLLFRPADTIEVAESWELAMEKKTTPSVLSLSRQNISTVRTKHTKKNMTSFGAYVLEKEIAKRKVILMATGSEVEIALAAREALEARGIGTRVVSMPCWELFEEQDPFYRRRVLPSGSVRVGIEAGVRQGWDQWLYGEGGKPGKAAFVGMEGFGASAPADELYKRFGISVENIVGIVEGLL